MDTVAARHKGHSGNESGRGRQKSAAATSLVEFLSPSVVPENVKQSADGGLAVLGVDHDPSVPEFP
jgi:hypothetical protein